MVAEDESPKVQGREPVFRHLDDSDVPWQQVKRQRNADGTEASVLEKWLAFSPDPQYLSLYARYDPGMIVRRHGHYSPHVVFVLDGELEVGDVRCPPGTHIELPKIISVDDHIVEPRELWWEALPPGVRERGPRVVREKVRLEFKGGHYGFERDASGAACSTTSTAS
ncbi:MAG: hypothetical protein U5K30_09585 [Acidimicrobiales bacterium]|nr:hypothetical protein [Acidimicrobiales bacterium]